MSRLMTYGLATILLFAALGLLFARAQAPTNPTNPMNPTNPSLVQTTGDVEVRILPAATEIVLPVGASFVFSRQSDGRVVLRFLHMNAIPGRLGK